ncbi:MAG: TetR/AcrR family transcriptional regulator [Terriglobales bacterium]|jgi:AcrR family transcriptional regulator
MSTSQVRIPAEERRQQILELATALFARQGYQGTTTRQIAQQVHVNEAIIFRHFPTKEELYWAVIENQIRVRGGRARLEARLAAGGSDRELLTAIAEELLSRDATLSRLLLYTALENHELTHRFFRTHVAQYLELLADYIRRGIAEARFRDVDPQLAARGFLGMVWYHFQIQELFGGKRVQTFDPHHVSQTLVDVWLCGMERD